MDEGYTMIASSIIKEQEKIVGPIAWSEAQKISGITIHDHDVAISGNGKQIVEKLVGQYETLFGQASIEVCRDAVRSIRDKIKNIDLPQVLQ